MYLTADPAPAGESLVPCLLPNNQRRLGRYRLLYRFATGGMASLYLAQLAGTDSFKKTVAIKVMHGHLSSDPEFVMMFIDEARLASRIVHPNVVQILELGRVETSHFIAMEYVEGESVLELMRRLRPPCPLAARVVAEAAAGLHAAHELCDVEGRHLQVVHRDISPDNILLGYGGAVKVTDFGVARARDSLHFTSAGTLKGKFSYMAPEQLDGEPIDHRADIFSLGVVLYELTVGRRLFKREADADTLKAVERCEVPAPSRVVRHYPRALEKVVLAALERDPARRPASMRELQEALERYLLRTGELVTPAAVGRFISSVFTERVEQKRQMRRRFEEREESVVPDMDLPGDSSARLPAITVSIVVEGGGGGRMSPALSALAWAPGRIRIAAGWLWSMLTRRRPASLVVLLTALVVGAVLASGYWLALRAPPLQVQIPVPVPVRVTATHRREPALRRARPAAAPVPATTRPAPEAQAGPVKLRKARPAGRDSGGRARCRLQLSSTPRAHVFLGRRYLGRTPLRARVPAGRLALRLIDRRLGLRAVRRLVARRSRQRAHLVLGRGTIRFNLRPGHHVRLDDRLLGRAPLRPVQVHEGPHVVTVVDPFRYRRQRFRVKVREGRTTWVSQAW
jgi:serine/threonine-protein kinase